MTPLFDLTEKTAIFSPCRKWRYALTRIWDKELPVVQFIGLNPSTADETLDDPTIRRCIGYARDWSFGGLVMTNMFAYRATYPKDMLSQDDPIGPENDAWITTIANRAGKIVAAWGSHGNRRNRDLDIHVLLKGFDVLCFGLTKNSQPKHPLYLKKETELVSWIELCF